jgi:hypothetical protein
MSRKLDLFPSSGEVEKAPTLLGPLQKPNIIHWTTQSQSQSLITTDNQSASPSWCQALIWDPRPIFLSLSDFLLDSCGLLFCSALSDERTGR